MLSCLRKSDSGDQTILIDCLTLLIANLIYQDWPLQPAGDSTGESPEVLSHEFTDQIEDRVMTECGTWLKLPTPATPR